MTELSDKEQEFFKVYGIGKPVIKKWYYEGYYEDWDWTSHYEDCTNYLNQTGMTIKELNNRIQELKTQNKNNNDIYNRSLDAVKTEIGTVSGAFIDTPKFTDAIYLNLLYLLISRTKQWSYKSCYCLVDCKWLMLSNLIWEAKQDTEFYRLYKNRIKKLFEAREE